MTRIIWCFLLVTGITATGLAAETIKKIPFVSFTEVQETQEKTYSFLIEASDHCVVASWGILECTYMITKGEFNEDDFNVRIEYDRSLYGDDEDSLLVDVFVSSDGVVVQFKVDEFEATDLNQPQVHLNESVEQVNLNLGISKHSLILTYEGPAFDHSFMGSPYIQTK